MQLLPPWMAAAQQQSLGTRCGGDATAHWHQSKLRLMCALAAQGAHVQPHCALGLQGRPPKGRECRGSLPAPLCRQR